LLCCLIFWIFVNFYHTKQAYDSSLKVFTPFAKLWITFPINNKVVWAPLLGFLNPKFSGEVMQGLER
jgi:hypothetical protein